MKITHALVYLMVFASIADLNASDEQKTIGARRSSVNSDDVNNLADATEVFAGVAGLKRLGSFSKPKVKNQTLKSRYAGRIKRVCGLFKELNEKHFYRDHSLTPEEKEDLECIKRVIKLDQLIDDQDIPHGQTQIRLWMIKNDELNESGQNDLLYKKRNIIIEIFNVLMKERAIETYKQLNARIKDTRNLSQNFELGQRIYNKVEENNPNDKELLDYIKKALQYLNNHNKS